MRLVQSLYRATVTALLFVWAGAALAKPVCQISPFTPPAQDQARLDSGSVGHWRTDAEQVMIRIHDIDGQPWDYYSLQKKPANHPEPLRLVLFLHGFPEFAAAWEDEISVFGDSVHAVALDLKGHRYSSSPHAIDEYDFIEIGWEMRAIIQCLGYQRATVVGHDFGGAIGWILGMMHPDALDGLMIMGIPHPYLFGRELLNPNSDQQDRIQYMYHARGTSLSDQLAFTRIIFSDTSIFRSGFYRGKRILRLMNEAWLPLSGWGTMKNYYRAMPIPATEQDYPAQLSDFQRKIYTIKVPTVVLWGEQDPYFSPAVWQGLPDLVPDLTVVSYPQGTHWVNHEAADLHDRIRELLARTGHRP